VRERIGSGSHGVVFHAVSADRPESGSYALKLALEPGDARFEREAQLLSRLSHPSVPRLEGSGSWKSPRGETYPYVVMQWVEGLSLYEWAAKYGLTLRQAIEQLAQVARALEATHRHGVHRDVKGGNVRVSAQGHAVLLDFGSCWYPGASPLTGRAMPPSTGPYRSPQLLFFEYALALGAGQYYEAQPADDVYALGITAYRLLAGVYPPRDSDSDDSAVRLVAPRGLDDACPELSALILRMLSEDPQARGSAGEVAAALERLLEYPRPALERPWVENPSQPPTEKTHRLAPLEYTMRDQAALWVLAGSFFFLLLLWVLPMRNGDQREGAFTKPQRRQRTPGTPDAGTSGLGEDATASVAPAETSPVSQGKITRELPKRPLDGQKRPPCPQRGAVAINGGCWWRPVEADTAPCESGLYEYAGRCYIPVLTAVERVPTSEEPQ
jgi:serine/threonine protein kinase